LKNIELLTGDYPARNFHDPLKIISIELIRNF